MKNLLSMLGISTLCFTSASNLNTNINSNNKISKTEVSNFYVLGDSLSDNGAALGLNNAILKLQPNPNFDSVAMGKYYYNNSDSNGPVAAEILANKLGFQLTPAWNFNLEGKTFNHLGNNYSMASETAGDYYPGQQDPGTINMQENALLVQHQINDKDTILFAIGGNDMFMAQYGPFSPQWVINEALKKKVKRLKN